MSVESYVYKAIRNDCMNMILSREERTDMLIRNELYLNMINNIQHKIFIEYKNTY